RESSDNMRMGMRLSSLKKFEETFVNAMTLGVLIACIASFGWVFSRHLEYDINWLAFYDKLHKFGDSCELAIGEWQDQDTFASVAAAAHPYIPFKMPYRSAGKPLPPIAGPKAYLITRC